MSIYEAIGIAWVVFTSALSHLALIYLAWIGIQVLVKKGQIRVVHDPEREETVRMLPVSWGRPEDGRVVEVSVKG